MAKAIYQKRIVSILDVGVKELEGLGGGVRTLTLLTKAKNGEELHTQVEEDDPELILKPSKAQLDEIRESHRWDKLIEAIGRMPPWKEQGDGYTLVAVSVTGSGNVLLKCTDPGCQCDHKCDHIFRDPEQWLDLFQVVPDDEGHIKEGAQYYALVSSVAGEIKKAKGQKVEVFDGADTGD